MVHGPFKLEVEKTKWKVGKKLNHVFSLFSNNPAKRTSHVFVIDGSNVFPKQFCGILCVELEPVDLRAIEICGSVCKIMKHFQF